MCQNLVVKNSIGTGFKMANKFTRKNGRAEFVQMLCNFGTDGGGWFLFLLLLLLREKTKLILLLRILIAVERILFMV